MMRIHRSRSAREARAQRSRHGSVVTLASTSYATTALGVITGPLVARSLGPAGRGEYAAITIYSSLTVIVVALGITTSITYTLQTVREDPGRVLGAVWRFSALTLLPSALLAAGIALLVLRDYGPAVRVGAAVFIVLAPLGVLQLCLTSFLLAEGALGVLTRVKAVPLLISAVGVVALFAAGHLTLIAYLIVSLVALVVPVVITYRGVDVRPKRGGRLGPKIRFGIRAYPGTLASLANVHLDQALIAPFLGATDLGYYAIAVSLSNLPLALVQALAARGISQVTLPSGGLDVHLAAQVLRRGIFLACASCLLVAAVVPAFIPLLYGSTFARAVPLCLVLLLGTVALGITTMTAFMLTLSGRPGATSTAELAALIATVAGLLALLPIMGVLGASITSAVAYWTRAAVQLRTLRRSGVRGFVPRREDMTFVLRTAVDRPRSAFATLQSRRLALAEPAVELPAGLATAEGPAVGGEPPTTMASSEEDVPSEEPSSGER